MQILPQLLLCLLQFLVQIYPALLEALLSWKTRMMTAILVQMAPASAHVCQEKIATLAHVLVKILYKIYSMKPKIVRFNFQTLKKSSYLFSKRWWRRCIGGQKWEVELISNQVNWASLAPKIERLHLQHKFMQYLFVTVIRLKIFKLIPQNWK